MTDSNVSVFEEDWDKAYACCSRWGKSWKIAKGYISDCWPEGIQLHEGKMFYKGYLCVPSELTGRVVRAYHSALGHIGHRRLWQEMSRRLVWGMEFLARKLTNFTRCCEICQACEHPHVSGRTPVVHTPVPPNVMESVAIDVFYMPKMLHNGKVYDCFVACVDRLSGWVVAIPERRLGLRADKVACKMFRRAWDLFGIPR